MTIERISYERGAFRSMEVDFSVFLEDQFSAVGMNRRFRSVSRLGLALGLWRACREMRRLERLSRPFRKRKGWL